jgi:hypothetical protein
MFVALGEPATAICGDCLDHLIFSENPDAGPADDE